MACSERISLHSWRLPLVIAAAACAAPGDDSSVIGDRPANTIYTATPEWSPATQWQIAPQPRLTIGESDGGQTALYLVWGVAVMPDGHVVVANAGTHELRVYHPTGAFARTIGRQGGGPGEFESLQWVARVGPDTVATYDSHHRRVSMFTVDGILQREFRLRTDEAGAFDAVGVFEDGSVLVTRTPHVASDPRYETGLHWPTTHLFRVDQSGVRWDSLGTAPGAEVFILRSSSGVMGAPPVLGRRSWFAVRGDDYLVATNDSFRLEVYDTSGALRRRILRVHEPRPVDDGWLADMQVRAAEARRRAPERVRPRLREIVELRSIPAVMPAFGRSDSLRRCVLWDAAGNIWVLEYHPDRFGPNDWTVFNDQGAWLGTVTVPPGLDLQAIGEDYVAGVIRDELDVERVAIFDLHKPVAP